MRLPIKALALWALVQAASAAHVPVVPVQSPANDSKPCTCAGSSSSSSNNTVNNNTALTNSTKSARPKAYPPPWCDVDDYEYRVTHNNIDDEYTRPWKLNGTRYCGLYDTGFLPNARELIKQMPGVMEKEEWKKQITVPANTCIRIKCWNTTGLYVCNARTHDITLHSRWDLAAAFERANGCCQGHPVSVIKQRASGEWRHPCGWSAIVAYANCARAPVTAWPYGPFPVRGGGNPNGHCLHGDADELVAPPIPDESDWAWDR